MCIGIAYPIEIVVHYVSKMGCTIVTKCLVCGGGGRSNLWEDVISTDTGNFWQEGVPDG